MMVRRKDEIYEGVVAATLAVLEQMDRCDLNDLRSEMAHYIYGATRFDRQPQSEALRDACRQMHAAMKEMIDAGWDDDPLTIIDRLAQDFSDRPTLQYVRETVDVHRRHRAQTTP